MTDKRMYFVRNAAELNAGITPSLVEEFQVNADADIVGELHYGPYYFTIWEFGFKEQGESRSLCLRVPYAPRPENHRPWQTATKSGFYHGGDIADEIVALSSLFLRRRLKVGPVVRLDDTPRMFSRAQNQLDPSLLQGQSNLADLAPWLTMVGNLDPKLHEPFILAAKLYSQALTLIDSSPDLAYLNLVSCVEVLAQDHVIQEPGLAELDEQLDLLVSQVTDEQLRDQIKARMLSRERWISRKFVDLVVSHTDTSFWEREGRPQLGRVQPTNLPDLMKNVYRQRSRTLHVGEPFPPYIFDKPHQGEEIPVFLGMTAGDRRWEPKDFIPYPWFLEVLVNHVLQNFLKRRVSQVD